MHVSLEARVGSDLLEDDSTNPTSLGIPSHVVTDLESFRHRSFSNQLQNGTPPTNRYAALFWDRCWRRFTSAPRSVLSVAICTGSPQILAPASDSILRGKRK